MKRKITGLTLALSLSCTLVSLSSADETAAVGLRIGFSHEEVNGEAFQQYEVSAEYPLPWAWQWSGGWQLNTRLEGTAGALQGDGKMGFIGSLGPSLVVSTENSPWRLSLGFSPTVLSKSTFDAADLGGNIQFISHIGIRYQLSRTLEIGYRFQHMSNAHIEKPNPGLDMHVLQLNYRFNPS